MKQILVVLMVLGLVACAPVAAQEGVPTSLPEFLEWGSGAGAAIVFALLLKWALDLFPKLAMWYAARSPKQTQAITMGGSIALALAFWGMQVGFGLTAPPQDAMGWGNLLFSYVVVPLFAGVALRTIVILTPNAQTMWLMQRRE